VTPKHVAISCGEKNEYGFPHRELLDRLDAIGAVYHRTDELGTLCYLSDGETVRFVNED
jgi:competence protein ComEC